MPVMNGFECTKKIRNFEKKNNITDKRDQAFIVGLSAHCNDINKERCIQSGMNCYSKLYILFMLMLTCLCVVTKPFDSSVIGKMLREIRLV